MSDEPKTITHDTYLKALALCAMASDLYVQARKLQLHGDQVLGIDDGSHVSDAVYGNEPMAVRDFDEALRRERITVEPELK